VSQTRKQEVNKNSQQCNPPEPVRKNAISLYWIRHLRKIGVVGPKTRDKSNKTGKSPHEVRDVFRSLWEKSSAKGSVAEFLMGHKVDPLEYNKAFRDEDP